jgi:hypothetical protein
MGATGYDHNCIPISLLQVLLPQPAGEVTVCAFQKRSMNVGNCICTKQEKELRKNVAIELVAGR